MISSKCFWPLIIKLLITLYWSGSLVKFLVVSGNNQSASLKSLVFTLFSGPDVWNKKNPQVNINYFNTLQITGCIRIKLDI